MSKLTNEDIKEIAEKYRELEGLEKRKYTVDGDREREAYQRDYTRIMYASSFRRMQGKMQLLGIKNDSFFRNRLTHSLEVCQIARSIAEEISNKASEVDDSLKIYNSKDIYVIEAISLAHDLGNTPFGHHGEKIMNELISENTTYLKNSMRFEGNAQTLRILTNLEKKGTDFRGLNLTYRTLLGVCKYFIPYSLEKKKFIYCDDYKDIKEFLEDNRKENIVRTLDVQIMDIADQIAYAAHDLEDALSLKLFTIDEVLYEMELRKDIYPGALNEFNKLVDKAKEKARVAKRFRSSEEYSSIFRKELTSIIVYTLINDISWKNVTEKEKSVTGTMHQKEIMLGECLDLAKALKYITFECINRTDIVKHYERKGDKVIKGLYEVYSNNEFYLPIEFRKEYYGSNLNDQLKEQLIIDYIAGMMDSFAISSYKRFYGESSLDTIY